MARIQFSNGVTVNFNGSPTQRDIEEVASQLKFEQPQESQTQQLDRESADTYGASFPARTGEGPVQAGLKAAGNLPSSALSLGKALGTAAAHPVQTGQGISSIIAGGAAKVARKVAPDFFSQTPETEHEEAFNSFTQILKDRFGSTENLQRTATNDPVGFATDIAGLIGGGASALGKTAQLGKAVSTVAKPVTKTASTVAGAAGNAVKNTAGFAARQATGLSSETMGTALKMPEELGAARKIGLDRATLGENLKNTIDARLQEFSDLGKAYEPIRSAPVKVTLPADWFTQILERNKVILDKGKISITKESPVLSQGDVASLQHFYDLYAKDPSHTPNSFLNTRNALDELAKWDSAKTGNLERIIKEARQELNRYRNQVPNLEDADVKYAPVIKEIKEMKSEWIDKKTGQLKDSAVSQIANSANAGKGGENLAVNNKLRRLEEIMPGVTKQIRLVKAIEDIERAGDFKTGVYNRGPIIGGSFYFGGPIAGVLAAILAAPEIAIPLLRGLGLTGKKLQPILDAIKKAASDVNNFKTPEAVENYIKNAQPGLSIKDVSKGAAQAPLTLKTLTRLQQEVKKDFVSRQTIEDMLNRPDVKQPEKDLIRGLLGDEKEVNVKAFTERVQGELLPLERGLYATGDSARYENVSLPNELRGPVANYKEHVYQSPIKTSAGGVHFNDSNVPNYFAHTRIEDLPDKVTHKDMGYGLKVQDPLEAGSTRRVIEIQSDLFQKGRLENENFALFEDIVRSTTPEEKAMLTKKAQTAKDLRDFYSDIPVETFNKMRKGISDSDLYDFIKGGFKGAGDDLAKLEPFRNIWWERIVREEVKQAAKDGKTKLQFPTGETAMKIEGLGERASHWRIGRGNPERPGFFFDTLTPQELKVGALVNDRNTDWIITDVLGDGKFKAVPKDSIRNTLEGMPEGATEADALAKLARDPRGFAETFDISGKVDTNSPIYKFYEKDVARYLKNKYGGKVITDPQGVQWVEIDIKKDMAKLPIEAFGIAGGIAASQDE